MRFSAIGVGTIRFSWPIDSCNLAVNQPPTEGHTYVDFTIVSRRRVYDAFVAGARRRFRVGMWR